ncbi:hypothetical protein GCM10007387_17870 [Pseudoduganella albidiflava]|uniref:Uncharacterized protein n=1 Tax=Pseudoduganella albidiflava TaxID=321983 RepID=A0AA87XUX8_9BURK|nr:hypothetical protein GCM10007387_17870 [Pseudoduganella albidiflava]
MARYRSGCRSQAGTQQAGTVVDEAGEIYTAGRQCASRVEQVRHAAIRARGARQMVPHLQIDQNMPGGFAFRSVRIDWLPGDRPHQLMPCAP